jgi:hypothetical protein
METKEEHRSAEGRKDAVVPSGELASVPPTAPTVPDTAPADNSPPSARTVFVVNLPFALAEDDLKSTFTEKVRTPYPSPLADICFTSLAL